jgi:hypothetical protein
VLRLLAPQRATLEELILDGNKLGGVLPPEIGAFAQLRLLNFFHMGLTGPPLTDAVRLLAPLASTLQVLALDHNPLGGALLSDIAAFTQLTELHLSEMRLEGPLPAELGGLARLSVLYLNDNSFTGRLPRELGNLVNLTALDVSENRLTGDLPQELGKLENLTTLDLYRNGFTGPPLHETLRLLAPLASTLEVLGLNDNKLGGTIPPDVQAFSKLEVLGMWSMELEGTARLPFARVRMRARVEIFGERQVSPTLVVLWGGWGAGAPLTRGGWSPDRRDPGGARTA